MGNGLFRSEEMELYQVWIPASSDYSMMNKLATLGSLHFMDMNSEASVLKRPYETNLKQVLQAQRDIE